MRDGCNFRDGGQSFLKLVVELRVVSEDEDLWNSDCLPSILEFNVSFDALFVPSDFDILSGYFSFPFAKTRIWCSPPTISSTRVNVPSGSGSDLSRVALFESSIIASFDDVRPDRASAKIDVSSVIALVITATSFGRTGIVAVDSSESTTMAFSASTVLRARFFSSD